MTHLKSVNDHELRKITKGTKVFGHDLVAYTIEEHYSNLIEETGTNVYTKLKSSVSPHKIICHSDSDFIGETKSNDSGIIARDTHLSKFNTGSIHRYLIGQAYEVLARCIGVYKIKEENHLVLLTPARNLILARVNENKEVLLVQYHRNQTAVFSLFKKWQKRHDAKRQNSNTKREACPEAIFTYRKNKPLFKLSKSGEVLPIDMSGLSIFLDKRSQDDFVPGRRYCVVQGEIVRNKEWKVGYLVPSTKHLVNAHNSDPKSKKPTLKAIQEAQKETDLLLKRKKRIEQYPYANSKTESRAWSNFKGELLKAGEKGNSALLWHSIIKLANSISGVNFTREDANQILKTGHNLYHRDVVKLAKMQNK